MQEDTSNFKYFLVKFSPGIDIMVELHQHLYWYTSRILVMGRSKCNEQSSMNSPQHNVFIMASCQFHLNFDTLLCILAHWQYFKTCYKLSAFKLKTYLQVLFLNTEHSSPFTQITEVHGRRRFSKNQLQGSTDYMRKWNPCWWCAGVLPMASLSHLPSLLH